MAKLPLRTAAHARGERPVARLNARLNANGSANPSSSATAFTLAPARPSRTCANAIRSAKINFPNGVPVSARKSPVK